MTDFPTMSPRKLTKIITGLGFVLIRQEGSHKFFKHADGRTTVIPFHSGKDIGRGLMREILKDLQLTPKEFKKLLK